MNARAWPNWTPESEPDLRAMEIAKEINTRVNTSLRFQPVLHSQMVDAAAVRGLSLNAFVVLAVRDFLERLLPPDEVKWTR